MIRPDFSPAVADGYQYPETTAKPDSRVSVATQPILRGSSYETRPAAKALTTQHDDEYSRLAKKLKGMFPENTLIIPAEIVKNVHSQLSSSEKKNFLLALAYLAKSYAICPVSEVARGAVAIGKSGKLYLANNIEFRNCLPGAYIHPLAFLVSTLRAHGEINVQSMAFSDELSGPDLELYKAIAWAPDCKVVVAGLSDPLKVMVVPKGEVDKRLQFPAGSQIIKLQCNEDLEEFAFGAACAAAHDSFSPVTDAKFGAVIVRKDGRVYPGSYLEVPHSYTVLGPLQGAIAAYLSDGNSYNNIEAIMVADRMPRNWSCKPQVAEIELIVNQFANEITVRIEEF